MGEVCLLAAAAAARRNCCPACSSAAVAGGRSQGAVPPRLVWRSIPRLRLIDHPTLHAPELLLLPPPGLQPLNQTQGSCAARPAAACPASCRRGAPSWGTGRGDQSWVPGNWPRPPLLRWRAHTPAAGREGVGRGQTGRHAASPLPARAAATLPPCCSVHSVPLPPLPSSPTAAPPAAPACPATANAPRCHCHWTALPQLPHLDDVVGIEPAAAKSANQCSAG